MILLKHTKYDYLIVGAGPFGSTCAYELTKKGKKCLVIDKRHTIGGNCYTENRGGIHIHKYGAHIFHTNEKHLWDYVNQFASFKQYSHNVIANYNGEIYSLPFNMWTFNQLWKTIEPDEAEDIIEKQRFKGKVTNLEEQALSMVGSDIFEKLIKGYTEKQWGKKCSELPPSIIKRLPVRFTWDNNYFNDSYVGIPVGGYTQIFENMLMKSDVELEVDYFESRAYHDSLASSTIYTGPIDKFFDYKFGKLDYRSLDWETQVLPIENFQGVPVMNFTDNKTKFTRIIEHKWFDNQGQKGTIISHEYPAEYTNSNEPYYPIRDDKNTLIYEKYKELANNLPNHYFGGRLATYTYFDMHQIIAQALNLVKQFD
jgi:UDP-galactopyranose mutase